MLAGVTMLPLSICSALLVPVGGPAGRHENMSMTVPLSVSLSLLLAIFARETHKHLRRNSYRWIKGPVSDGR